MLNRSLFFIFALLGLLTLPACGSEELSEPVSRDYETYIGSFTSLGNVRVNPIVTHLFETDDGEILYAYSDRYDLTEYSEPVEAYGVVSVYEEYDKAFFEVKRLSEADLTLEEEEEVTELEYRNVTIGALTTLYSNWKIQENSPTWVTFEIPTPAPETEGDSEGESSEEVLNDTIDWVLLSNALTTDAESDRETRAEEIRSYVLSNYADLSLVEGETTSIGPDQVLAVRYKTATGDIFVFIPRGQDLLEISYHYLCMEDALRIQHTNAFSSTLNHFRFIPEDGTVEEEASTESQSDADEPLITQVSIATFSTFSSSTFNFTISYPSSWYYVGGSTGYIFDDEPIEDVTAGGLLKLSFNASTQEGTVRNGTTVSVTRKVESRTYTLTGSAEYETVMETMLDSIQTTIAE